MGNKLFYSLLAVPILIQLVTLGVLLFADIGFDRPGRSGLDFDDFLVLLALYLFTLLFSVIFCLLQKSWKLAAAQAAVPLMIVLYAMIPIYDPQLDPKKYQHLVGKTQDEVNQELRRYRRWTSGYSKMGEDAEELEFAGYNGMTINYSKRSGRVVSVKTGAVSP